MSTLGEVAAGDTETDEEMRELSPVTVGALLGGDRRSEAAPLPLPPLGLEGEDLRTETSLFFFTIFLRRQLFILGILVLVILATDKLLAF